MTRRATYVALATAAIAGLAGSRFHFKIDDPITPAPEAPVDPFAKLRDEFATVHGEATKLIQDAAGANEGKGRELTKEEKETNDKRFARLKVIKATIDDHQKFATLAIADDPDDDGNGIITKPKDAPGKAEFNRGANPAITDPKKIDREEFGRAAGRWAHTGEMDRKFATITTATSSGMLLPKNIGQPITPNFANCFREAHALVGVKPVETSNTADLTIPAIDASAGGQVAENASSDTDNSPSVAESIRLPVGNPYQSGTSWFSNTQLAANDFDLASAVVPQLEFAKELGLESTIAAAMIADAGITQNVVSATTTGFTYANLVDLNMALPKKYDAQKVIILSKNAFAAAQKLVGSDGHPVLNLDPQKDMVYRFNGTPVLRCDYLEDFGVSKKIGLVISLLGFRLRDVTPERLTRYVNVPTKPDQTGLNLFANHAYGYAASAVAKFISAAS